MVLKRQRQRTGETMPGDEKKCHNCHDDDDYLKDYARGHVGRYCSVECQSEYLLSSDCAYLCMPLFQRRIGLATWQHAVASSVCRTEQSTRSTFQPEDVSDANDRYPPIPCSASQRKIIAAEQSY